MARAAPRAHPQCAVIVGVGDGNTSWRSRFLGWWYGSIAVGFLLLTLAHAIRREGPLMILPRLGIAIGFGVLAYGELHKKKR